MASWGYICLAFRRLRDLFLVRGLPCDSRGTGEIGKKVGGGREELALFMYCVYNYVCGHGGLSGNLQHT